MKKAKQELPEYYSWKDPFADMIDSANKIIQKSKSEEDMNQSIDNAVEDMRLDIKEKRVDRNVDEEVEKMFRKIRTRQSKEFNLFLFGFSLGFGIATVIWRAILL